LLRFCRKSGGIVHSFISRGLGFDSRRLHFFPSDTSDTLHVQNPHNAMHIGGEAGTAASPQSTHSIHSDNTFLHEKCARSVHALPEDLALVVDAWDHLPEAVKAGILAMVNAARQLILDVQGLYEEHPWWRS
jgi:hypothetical protein